MEAAKDPSSPALREDILSSDADTSKKRQWQCPVIISSASIMLFFITIAMKWCPRSSLANPLVMRQYNSEHIASKRIDLHYKSSKRSWRGTSFMTTHPFCNHDGFFFSSTSTRDKSVEQFLTTSSRTSTSRNIPLVGTNVEFDNQNFLTRLWQSLTDHPINHKLVVAGGCNHAVITKLETICAEQADLKIYHHHEYLGCAGGWNVILQYMDMHEDIPWAIILNSDIKALPGSLQKISDEVWSYMDKNRLFCLGHFTVRAGPDFSAFIISRHGLHALGFFDENIYPAYYEDDDFLLRFEIAKNEGLCGPMVQFSAEVIHGVGEGYVSGSYAVIDHMLESREEQRQGIVLAERLNRSKAANYDYVCEKWNCPRTAEIIKPVNCKYRRPFGHDDYPLSYWRVDHIRRACIDGDLNQAYQWTYYQNQSVQACTYQLDEN